MIKVGFKKITDDAVLPVKAHPRDSGFDLFVSEDIVIEPGETVVIATGIAIDIPVGYEAQVRPRSGVTSKTKLRVQLGTIDNDYTGEVGIIVDNTISTCSESYKEAVILSTIDGSTVPSALIGARRDPHVCLVEEYESHYFGTYIIFKGDKLAQLVIQAIPMVEAYEIDELPTTVRGNKGYGSSGY